MIKKKSPIPLKEQIKNYIIKGIASGEFTSGQKIPSINEISQKQKVARETVRLAFESLVNENYLVPEHGKGYFVKAQEQRKTKVTLLAKLDGVYIRPIYNALIKVLHHNAQVYLIDIHQQLNEIKSIIESMAYHQTTDYLILIPPRGMEQKLNTLINPFRRYLKIIWLDRAPKNTKDHSFTPDYQNIVKEVMNLFEKEINHTAYFSRNPEDHSVFSIMRNEFIKISQSKKLFFTDEKKLSQNIQNKKIKNVFCETDQEAIFLQNYLNALGIISPRDYQLLGCDNTSLCQLGAPKISSVDPGFSKMGESAGKVILNEWEDTSLHTQVEITIEHRETTLSL